MESASSSSQTERNEAHGAAQGALILGAAGAPVAPLSALSGEVAGQAKRTGRPRTTHGDTHGGIYSPEYKAWGAMIQRCTNPKEKAYHRYGGRGIVVCERWRSYENFLADVGRRPSTEHSLDRYPDFNGNYEPGNVRWATRDQQTANRECVTLVELGDEQIPLKVAARRLGLNPDTVSQRVRRQGMSPAEALFTPVGCR